MNDLYLRMTMIEYPDVWTIVEIGDTHKVLACFYGGYVHGDSWRLSSGITKFEETDTHWIIHNVSGSIYHCPKQCERLNTLLGVILARLIEKGGKQISFKEFIYATKN